MCKKKRTQNQGTFTFLCHHELWPKNVFQFSTIVYIASVSIYLLSLGYFMTKATQFCLFLASYIKYENFLGMLNGRYAMYPGQVERAPFLSLFYKILSQTSCFFRFKCSNPHGLINRKIHSLD